MKKIYLLLVLLFTGLQSVFAQFIWHSDLGTPHTGTVSLSWDTRSYMFQVDNGEEFGSTGDIWDALDAQLRAAGITWIRVNSVENPADGTFEVLPKKEVIELRKELAKLQKNLGGIKEMKRLPDAIFIVDPKKERICVQEAHTLGIPLIGICDTNCDPEELDYVIPGNDDAIRAVKLIVSKMADAVIEANQGTTEAEEAEVEEATEE